MSRALQESNAAPAEQFTTAVGSKESKARQRCAALWVLAQESEQDKAAVQTYVLELEALLT
jgi:hypothetical protein